MSSKSIQPGKTDDVCLSTNICLSLVIHLVHRAGHLLTLGAAVVLWWGILTAIDVILVADSKSQTVNFSGELKGTLSRGEPVLTTRVHTIQVTQK